MEWVETTGRTVEEAKERALDELGVDDQDAEFEVVEEPKAGLFGMVRLEARVRARVRPTQPRAKVERRRTRRGDGGGRGQRSRSGAGSGATSESGAEATPEANGDVGGSDVTKGDASPPSRGRGARGGSSRRRNGSVDERPAVDKDGEKVEEVTLEQQVEVMEEFLDGLVEAFGLSGEVSSEKVDDEIVEIRIEGEDLGLLIGPKGQTLAAVQELARTVAQRQLAGPHQGRVRLDVSGYRKRRAEALTRFALQVAEDVKSTGTPKMLEPMSPPDRKVVHDALTDVEGVRTASEGEDRRRRVVVLPD